MPEPSSSPALLRLPRHPRSLAAQAAGADRWLGPFFVLAGALLVAGWVLPMMTVRRLLFLGEPVSILEGMAELWAAEHYFLFAVIVVFTLLFPSVKLVLALLLWYGADARGARLRRTLDWLEALGRWSMLDVFVVALGIVAVQVSLVSDVTTHAGLYVFTAAVVLSMLGLRRLIVLARRAAA